MDADTRRTLEAFLVENDELARLNGRLGRLNILGVLRCEQAESRHSNVLAWLLDPEGGHGLGDLFLRRLLSRILMANDQLATVLTAAQVELMPSSPVDVRREWRNCDVLVHHADGNWCLVIENKIRAGESKGQLRRYEGAVRAEFPGAAVIPILLTLDGDDPSDDGAEAGWTSLSYGDVVDLVDHLVSQRESQVPPDASVLLRHWIEALRRMTMTDPELVDLCRAIYRKHRAAVDLIVEYGRVSGVLDACAEYAHGMGGLAFDPVAKGNRIWFMPKAMAKALRVVSPGWRHLPDTYPVAWWFEHMRRRGKLKLCMEVGPITDGDMRVRLMEALKEAGFEFWERGALRPEARFTRIYSRNAPLPKDDDGEVDDDAEAVAAVARKLWEAAGEDETKRLIDALKGFAWK